MSLNEFFRFQSLISIIVGHSRLLNRPLNHIQKVDLSCLTSKSWDYSLVRYFIYIFVSFSLSKPQLQKKPTSLKSRGHSV